MLSYEINEAETLLDGKLSTAKQSMSNCEEDLDFLREQITVRARQPIPTRHTLTCHRPWRLHLLESTIGKLCRRGKKRATTRRTLHAATPKTMERPTVDGNISWKMITAPASFCSM